MCPLAKAIPVLPVQTARLYGALILGAFLSFFPTGARAQGVPDRVGALENAVTSLTSTVNTQGNQITSLTSTVNTQNNQITSLTSAVSAQSNQISQLTAAVCALYNGLSAKPPASLNCPPASKLIFTTSQRFPPNLGGVSGADAKCASAANQAGLLGTFKAWVSTGSFAAPISSPAATFTHFAGPYKMVDGTTVAANWAQLTSGTLSHAINLDETGAPITGFNQTEVWTGTNESGQALDFNCNNWTATTGPSLGVIGESANSDFLWTRITSGNFSSNGQSGGNLCISAAQFVFQSHLYCVQQ